MTLSWKLGRVAGIDVFLHPTLPLLLLYVGVTSGLFWLLAAAALFGCVLLHELGHALAAQAYGIRTADITLYPIGGVARLARMPRKAGPELVIALAGPAVNLAIAGALLVVLVLGGPVASVGTGVGEFLTTLLVLNLVLVGFNLVPAFPMDGGRVLRALLSGWLGRLRATEIAAGIGRVLAVAFGLWSLFWGESLGGTLLHVVLALFIYHAAGFELGRVRQEERARTAWEEGGRGPAPEGYRWVYLGQGVWRLAPVVVLSRDELGMSRRWG